VELRFYPESSGLCIFRLDKTPKPTTNFLQLFGSKISKNYLDIDYINLLEYCKGNDIKVDKELHNLEPGFIAVRFKNIVIGCAHWNEKTMKNQLPKSRRCKINYY
jgi:NOL1/NOP2/fmu family ribosome biogenesis protein